MRGSGRRSWGVLALLLILLTALVCSGCGVSRYEAVELEEETETEAVITDYGPDGDGKRMLETRAAVTLAIGDDKKEPETGADGENDVQSGETEGGTESAEETEAADPFAPADDMVVVTADVLNVRENPSEDSRIYVQLKRGDLLPRTGQTEQWSRVIYDGKTAYVAADMVEVKEAETEEAESPATEPEEAVAAAVPGGEEALAEAEVPFNGHTVAIDAGHQAKANGEKEPIGPSSETMKAKMPEGFVGTVNGLKEYELTLTVAKKLEAGLKSRGYRVVMIRTGHDVNMSNAERAIAANESGADVFIRLHANAMENSSVYGALTMCMTGQNPYHAELHDKSYSLSKKLIDNICAQTGTKNRGVQETDNSGAINWSEIPVSVVEMGFLSNPDEERWLGSEEYQDKIVAGIMTALDSYFAEGN